MTVLLNKVKEVQAEYSALVDGSIYTLSGGVVLKDGELFHDSADNNRQVSSFKVRAYGGDMYLAYYEGDNEPLSLCCPAKSIEIDAGELLALDLTPDGIVWVPKSDKRMYSVYVGRPHEMMFEDGSPDFNIINTSSDLYPDIIFHENRTGKNKIILQDDDSYYCVEEGGEVTTHPVGADTTDIMISDSGTIIEVVTDGIFIPKTFSLYDCPNIKHAVYLGDKVFWANKNGEIKVLKLSTGETEDVSGVGEEAINLATDGRTLLVISNEYDVYYTA